MMGLQEWIYKLEVGPGTRVIRLILVLLGLLALSAIYDLREYHNFSNAEARSVYDVMEGVAVFDFRFSIHARSALCSPVMTCSISRRRFCTCGFSSSNRDSASSWSAAEVCACICDCAEADTRKSWVSRSRSNRPLVMPRSSTTLAPHSETDESTGWTSQSRPEWRELGPFRTVLNARKAPK